jgi:hypothetical protein
MRPCGGRSAQKILELAPRGEGYTSHGLARLPKPKFDWAPGWSQCRSTRAEGAKYSCPFQESNLNIHAVTVSILIVLPHFI